MNSFSKHHVNFDLLCDAIIGSICFIKTVAPSEYKDRNYKQKMSNIELIRESYETASFVLDSENMETARSKATEFFDELMLSTPIGELYKLYLSNYQHEDKRVAGGNSDRIKEAIFRAGRHDYEMSFTILSKLKNNPLKYTAQSKE